MSLGMSWLLLDLSNQADAADNRRRRAEMRTISNKPFQMTEKEFQKTYRLSKSLVNRLVQELSTVIPKEKRSDALSVENKVLIALAFFATGSYQNLVGQNIYHYVSQPTVSKAIKEVTKALNIPHIFKKYVYFPETQQKRDKIKKRFYDKFKIPGVIGCIDGTHVAIIRPTLYEERYFNRKGYHSLNVMILCDENLNILCIDPSSPGSTHDSIVWRDHPLNHYINEKYNNGEIMFFLGDSGYPLRKTMMTPFLNAIDGTPESHYYKLQVSARNTVERCIGVLKARFRCLLAARMLHYTPLAAAQMVNACAVLHNIAVRARLDVPILNEEEISVEQSRQLRDGVHQFQVESDVVTVNQRRGNIELQRGRQAQQALIERLWRERNRL